MNPPEPLQGNLTLYPLLSRNTTIVDSVKLWDNEAANPQSKIGSFNWTWASNSSAYGIPLYEFWADNSVFMNEVDPDGRC